MSGVWNNVAPISDPLRRATSLCGVTFDDPTGKGRDVGLVPDEVESVYPAAVKLAADGSKTVDLAKLVPLLLGAVNTLHERVRRLEAASSAAPSNGRTSTKEYRPSP